MSSGNDGDDRRGRPADPLVMGRVEEMTQQQAAGAAKPLPAPTPRRPGAAGGTAIAPSSTPEPPPPEDEPRQRGVARTLRVVAAAAALGAAVCLSVPAMLDAIHRSNVAGTAPVVVAPTMLPFTVMSMPSGADVDVDGAYQGPTPAIFQMPCKAGAVLVLTIEQTGYAPWTKTVTCAAGGRVDADATLVRAKK